MKKLSVLLGGFALLTTLAFTYAVKPAAAIVDVKASEIVWKAYKVTGAHTGKLQLKSGSLTFNNDQLTGGSFEIDMNSISCTDMSGGMADKLVGHLKSEDFFNVAQHPTAKLAITKVISRGTPGAYKVQGNLTIKGITNAIKFNADIKEEGGKKWATTKITLDRADYDIRYGSGSFFENLGDKTIYDEFDLEVKIAVTGK